MHLRRSLATTAAAVLLTAPLLSSCGFNNNTDIDSDNTVGLNDRTGDAEGGVDVLSALIVAAQPGAGTFIATFSNTSPTEEAVFDTLEGGDTPVVPGDVEEISIAPQGYVNLADGGGVKVTGDFEAGDIVPMTIGFASGQTVEQNVVVVRACDPYEGLDPAVSESSTPTAEATDAPETVRPSGSSAPSESTEGSATAEESLDASASPYSCDFPRVGSSEDTGEGE